MDDDEEEQERVDHEDIGFQETGYETNRNLVDGGSKTEETVAGGETEQEKEYAKYRAKLTLRELHDNTKKTKNIARFQKQMGDKTTKQYLDCEY